MSTSPEKTQGSWRDGGAKEALREYADPLATLVVALSFAFLAGFGVVKQELLAAVTLGVLAAVAGVMFRQRYVIEQAKRIIGLVPGQLDEVADAVGKVERTVEALTSSDVYEILDHDAEWRIEAPDGSLAYGQKRKRLRFNQQDVVSIYELTQASGGRPGRVGEWKFTPEAIKNMGTISVDGHDHILLSLGARYQRGDELDYTSTRVIRDLFTDNQNRVSHRVRERTSHLRLRVMWSEDGVPKRVQIEELTPGQNSKTTEVVGEDLPLDNGRPFVELLYERPPRDHRVVISWWLASAS